jgi:hypothetical protein
MAPEHNVRPRSPGLLPLFVLFVDRGVETGQSQTRAMAM